MKTYEYKVESIERIPEGIPLKQTGTIETKEEWYGHSYGDKVGRIYDTGEIESYFKVDRTTGTIELFDKLRKEIKLETEYGTKYNFNSGKEYNCTDYYLMRKVVGHSSAKPTLTTERVDTFKNVEYEYTFEILIVADFKWKRYITETITTHGPHIYSLWDTMVSLDQLFETWAKEEKQGFKYNEDEEIEIMCYSNFGDCQWVPFEQMDDLMMAVNSIRIINIIKKVD